MSKKNKGIKARLAQLFGNQCFIDKLGLRKETTPHHYTGKNQKKKMEKLKKRKAKLTYHHIVEDRYGGEKTIENGALLSEENHMWFNQQPVADQIDMDRKFQQYKIRTLKAKGLLDDYGDFEISTPEAYVTEPEVVKKKKQAFRERIRVEDLPLTGKEQYEKKKYELSKIYKFEGLESR